jgi:prevent-host-death family protein
MTPDSPFETSLIGHGCVALSYRGAGSSGRTAELLNPDEEGEEVTITPHGRPVAVLVHPDELHVRRAEAALDEAARIHDLLAETATAPLPEGIGLAEQRAEELIAEIRASRDAR